MSGWNNDANLSSNVSTPQTITIKLGTCPECGRVLVLVDIHVSVRQPGLVEYVFGCVAEHVGNPRHCVLIDVAREVPA